MKRFKQDFAISLGLRGIAVVEDARPADELGRGVVNVSNHGGHQVDHGHGIFEVLADVPEKEH